MRRKILTLVAIPLLAGTTRVVATQLGKRGHTQAANRAHRFADTVRPSRRTTGCSGQR